MTLGRVLVVLTASLWPFMAMPRALACASCGSGGDDPMILYPNEINKLYVATGSSSGFRSIGPSGEELTAGGATRRYTTTVAVGHSFSPRAFTTLTYPWIRNVRGEESRSSPGDPSLAGRYTFVMTSIADPWRPQIQGVASYKAAPSRSLRNTQDPKTLLDVFGSGFPEARGGIDLWFGQMPVLFGAAHIIGVPLERSYGGVLYQPGLTQRTTATLGYRWGRHGKTLIGTNREQHAPLIVDRVAAPDSDQLNQSIFLTQDLQVNELATLRVTLSQQGAYGPLRNSARVAHVTLALMQTL